VGGGATIVKSERPGDHRRFQSLVLGDLKLQMRLRIFGSVVVILDGDLRQSLAADVKAMEVASRGHGENTGSGEAVGLVGVLAFGSQPAGRPIFQLLSA